MGEILSQDEVDALLKAVDDGQVPPAAPGHRGGVQTIDLTNQERSVRGRLPGLDLVLDRLTRALPSSLASFLGHVPQVSCRGAELVKLATVTARLAPPLALQVFRLSPLRGHGMLIVQAPLAAAVLEVVFGGSLARRAAPLTRELSPLEQRVLERLGRRVLEDLAEAFRPIVGLDPRYVRTETNPLFAAIGAPQELMLSVDLALAAEGQDDLELAVCLPNAALDPVRTALARVPQGADPGGEPGRDARWRAGLEAALAGIPVALGVELGRRAMRMREVLALAVGDVVALETGRDGPVTVRIAGRPRFLGTPGVSGGHHAVRITARL